MPRYRIVGNIVMSFMTKAASGYWDLFDPLNGYTAIHRSALEPLDFDRIAKRYDFENDLLVHLNILRVRARDVPIPAVYGDEVSGLKLAHGRAADVRAAVAGLLAPDLAQVRRPVVLPGRAAALLGPGPGRVRPRRRHLHHRQHPRAAGRERRHRGAVRRPVAHRLPPADLLACSWTSRRARHDRFPAGRAAVDGSPRAGFCGPAGRLDHGGAAVPRARRVGPRRSGQVRWQTVSGRRRPRRRPVGPVPCVSAPEALVEAARPECERLPYTHAAECSGTALPERAPRRGQRRRPLQPGVLRDHRHRRAAVRWRRGALRHAHRRGSVLPRTVGAGAGGRPTVAARLRSRRRCWLSR